jgi:rare lipoprotein A
MRIVLILSFLLASCSFLLSQNRQHGEASYYNDKYQGRKTASGELYDRSKYTAAHRTLPFGALVQVTNLKTNQSVIVKINDMGPSKESRIIDLSYVAAGAIGLVRGGVLPVQLDVLEEYPTANSPFAVGPVIGSAARPASTTNSSSNASSSSSQRNNASVSPAAAAPQKAKDDIVLPNIRPSSGSASTATAASAMRTGSAKTTEAVPADDKGLGLFKFFAQRVTAEGYGVQVGAFSDYRNVMEATATLSQNSINDFLVLSKKVDNKVVFKLIVGPFNSRGAADSFNNQLRLIPGFAKGMVLSLNNL